MPVIEKRHSPAAEGGKASPAAVSGGSAEEVRLALRGRITPAFRKLAAAAAAGLAGKWWKGCPEAERGLARAVEETFARFGQVAAPPSSGPLKHFAAALEQSAGTGYGDAVLDPLFDQIRDALPPAGRGRVERRVFIRGFLLEVALVEAYRLERASPRLGEGAGSTLWEFVRRKILIAVSRTLPRGSAELDDAVAEATNGLLGLDPRWRRQTVLEFDRSRSSLAAFVMRLASFHARDAIRRMPPTIALNLEIESGKENLPAARGEDQPVSADDLVAAVLRQGRRVPGRIDPAKPAGRKRLAILYGFLLSKTADEDHEAHTCPDGARLIKFVLCQGLPPGLVLGSQGGEHNHCRFDDPLPPDGSKRRKASPPGSSIPRVLTRGFRDDSCRMYEPAAGRGDQAWKNWRVLYTVAFAAAARREGFFPGPVEPEVPGSGDPPRPEILEIERLRGLCLRRRRGEPEPGETEVRDIIDKFTSWLAGNDRELFGVRTSDGVLQTRLGYPHLLLSSYAGNAFCALYATFYLESPFSVEDLRSALKDLRRWLRE